MKLSLLNPKYKEGKEIIVTFDLENNYDERKMY